MIFLFIRSRTAGTPEDTLRNRIDTNNGLWYGIRRSNNVINRHVTSTYTYTYIKRYFM